VDWIQTNDKFQLPLDGRYLVGVSGGRDSVALLHCLIGRGYNRLVICHFNHQLRANASDRDAKFTEQLAAKYETDFEIGSADVRALARKQKISIETAAREARYNFFARVAKKKRAPVIFLGHHADDLVETFLINLFRGAGGSGLSGFREISKRRINDVNLTIVRPLVRAWRIQIDEYVGRHRLKFREDTSNKDLALLRNRVRLQVIPQLEQTIGRNIRTSVWRAAMIAAEEENWIEAQLPAVIDGNLSVAELRKLPVALQRREILKWLRTLKITNVGFDLVEQVRRLLDQDARTAKINLPGDRHARRRSGKIFIESINQRKL